MLTAYFEKNNTSEHARGILYRDFPEYYKWDSHGKLWIRRAQKNHLRQIRRVVCANPAEGERYYLRVLLNHMAGATLFTDLRTVSGMLLPTFHEAAERRGLIEADNTLHKGLAKATLWMMPYALRRLFITILVFCELSDVLELWEKHKEAMSEDYRCNNQSSFTVEQMVLIDIQKLLESMQKDIKMYPLPDIDDTYDPFGEIPREIFKEASVEVSVDDMALSKTLNEEQQTAYNEIMSAIDSDHGGLFFMDGPGGTRKTYLYRALLATIRSQNKIIVATATSGVAASIMHGGKTAHSRFKIPLTLDDGAFCSFTK
jgi:primosomal protein N'